MIHPTAIVSSTAQMGSNIEIGAFSIISDNVIIGDNSVVGNFCELGHKSKSLVRSPLIIGRDSLIRSHSVFYEGSSFGDRLTTGHRVTVREGTRAGTDFQIGTLCDIQGYCEIGDYVRTHSNVHIGQKSKIHDFVWLFPFVVLTNDPHPPSDTCIGCEIFEFAVVATMSVVLPGVKIGRHSLVAAHSSVNRDIKPFTVVGGSPAKYLCQAKDIIMKDGSLRAAYPWTSHFSRGYPEDVIRGWRADSQFDDN